VVSNVATASGAGVATSTLNGCIVFYNFAGLVFNGGNYDSSTLNYCCTTPSPASGAGNLTNEPAFLDLANGNFHLQSNSPCINAGDNSAVTATTDLEGNSRVAGGTVDIGAYEFQSPASRVSYAWLQQYGLPADGSADRLDADADGMNNYAEWRTGTSPTNAASFLYLTSVVPSAGDSGATITWQSVSGINYFIKRGSDLSAPAMFTTIATNIPGLAGATSYTDQNPAGPLPRFYRVGVQ